MGGPQRVPSDDRSFFKKGPQNIFVSSVSLELDQKVGKKSVRHRVTFIDFFFEKINLSLGAGACGPDFFATKRDKD